MTRRPSIPVLLAVLASPITALAQPAPAPAQLEAKESQAKRACEGGRVQEGTRLLTELLNQTNDGTYIFNLARCYQSNGQLDQALLHFRSYLRRSDVDATAAARAREYIAVLERTPTPPRTPPSPPPAATALAPAPAPTIDAPATADAPSVAASTTRPPSPGRALRISGLAAGAAGVAGLAIGGYYGKRAHDLSEETARAEKAGDKAPDWFLEQNAAGVRAEKRQWIFLGAGATALVAGGVLYYLGVRVGDRAQAALIVPVALPRGGGALLHARF